MPTEAPRRTESRSPLRRERTTERTTKRTPSRLRRWWERNRLWITVAALVLAFLVVYLWQNIFIFIYPGEQGVLWSRFGGGTVMDEVYEEGFHVIWPWNRMYVYNVRVQEINDELVVLAENGLNISVVWSARFSPIRGLDLPRLHQNVGPAYVEILVRPEVTSAVRRVVGNYTPEEIYARDEHGLLDEIKDSLSQQVAARYVHLDDILLKSLRLPPDIEKAIEDKLTHRHIALSYQYRLARELLERERKEIEAQGIQVFESISGIPILQWRGIDATVELAQSENAKVIVIGTDADSLPIILNADR